MLVDSALNQQARVLKSGPAGKPLTRRSRSLELFSPAVPVDLQPEVLPVIQRRRQRPRQLRPLCLGRVHTVHSHLSRSLYVWISETRIDRIVSTSVDDIVCSMQTCQLRSHVILWQAFQASVHLRRMRPAQQQRNSDITVVKNLMFLKQYCWPPHIELQRRRRPLGGAVLWAAGRQCRRACDIKGLGVGNLSWRTHVGLQCRRQSLRSAVLRTSGRQEALFTDAGVHSARRRRHLKHADQGRMALRFPVGDDRDKNVGSSVCECQVPLSEDAEPKCGSGRHASGNAASGRDATGRWLSSWTLDYRCQMVGAASHRRFLLPGASCWAEQTGSAERLRQQDPPQTPRAAARKALRRCLIRRANGLEGSILPARIDYGSNIIRAAGSDDPGRLHSCILLHMSSSESCNPPCR